MRKLEANTADTDTLFRMSRTLLGELLILASTLNSNQLAGAGLRMGKFAADLPWLVSGSSTLKTLSAKIGSDNEERTTCCWSFGIGAPSPIRGAQHECEVYTSNVGSVTSRIQRFRGNSAAVCARLDARMGEQERSWQLPTS